MLNQALESLIRNNSMQLFFFSVIGCNNTAGYFTLNGEMFLSYVYICIVKKRKPNVDALILNTLVSSMWKRGSFGELFVGNDGLNTDLKPKVLKILRMTYI